MVYRNPESGILYDDMPWKPKREHKHFRVRLADYEWVCVPPNAVGIDPHGYPYPPLPPGYSGRAAASLHADALPPVFITIPWTLESLGMAEEFWFLCRHWLGETAHDSVLDQVVRARGELIRLIEHPEPPPVASEPLTWDTS